MCGDHPTIKALIDYQQFCGIPGHAVEEPKPEASTEIEPKEVKAKLDRGDKFTLLDVREPHEWAICHIPGATLIPLGEVAKRLGELDKNAEYVMQCKSGKRSAQAMDILKQNGFAKVRNMRGGILAWSDTVDPSVPKY
jgi:adenylyltransferase/sulfurtransferase